MRVIYPFQVDSHAPGRFTYIIKNDDICNLTTHVKSHFENEVNLKNCFYWQEMQNYKEKYESRENAIGKCIAKLCYIDYLIESSKIYFELGNLTIVLIAHDVGDMNHSLELY